MASNAADMGHAIAESASAKRDGTAMPAIAHLMKLRALAMMEYANE